MRDHPSFALLGISVIAASVGLCAACSSPTPMAPTLPSAPVTISQSPTLPPNGRVTLTSIQSSRVLCDALTRQVGSSWPTWLIVQFAGDQVTLSFWDDGPPHSDPLQDPPGVYKGTPIANAVSATFTGGPGAMACPNDRSLTPRTGGTLTATITEAKIVGDCTEVYANNAETTALSLHFEADLDLDGVKGGIL
jgi:hypothetical protein